MAKTSRDVTVHNNGTTVSFELVSPAAREFVREHVETEPWQWLGSTLVVDHRFAEQLAIGLSDNGLVVIW